jgi:septum formation protein
MIDTPAVILASGSRTRARLLQNAGVPVVVDPAGVDEDEIKASMKAEGAPVSDVAQALADLKASRKSIRYPGAFVIGADQMLDCDGTWFDKPPTLDHARAQLEALAGRTHHLHTAAAVARDGAVIWRHLTRPALTMRRLSPDFLASYMQSEGDDLLGSVGAYRLEGRGAQLFAEIRGDYFSILGLPLLPLLDFLRTHKILPS